MQPLRAYPPLMACLRFSFTFFAALISIFVICDVIANLLKSRPIHFPALEHPLRTLISTAMVAFVTGILLFAICWPWAATINEAGLRGRTFWGRSANIPWSDIGSVTEVTVKGLPSLVVASASSKRKIWLHVMGVDAANIYRHISAYAGPDNILAQWFTPKSA